MPNALQNLLSLSFLFQQNSLLQSSNIFFCYDSTIYFLLFWETLALTGLKNPWISKRALSHLYYLFDLFLVVLTKYDAVGDTVQLEKTNKQTTKKERKQTNSFKAYRWFLCITFFHSFWAFCIKCFNLSWDFINTPSRSQLQRNTTPYVYSNYLKYFNFKSASVT